MSGQALDFMWGVWNQGLLTFTVWGPIVALFRVVISCGSLKEPVGRAVPTTTVLLNAIKLTVGRLPWRVGIRKRKRRIARFVVFPLFRRPVTLNLILVP